MLLVEIALTIWTWRRGWGAWALLPGAILFGASFLIGLAMGASGVQPEEMDLGAWIIGDVLLVLVLIGMIAKGRKPAGSPATHEGVTQPSLEARPSETAQDVTSPQGTAESVRASV